MKKLKIEIGPSEAQALLVLYKEKKSEIANRVQTLKTELDPLQAELQETELILSSLESFGAPSSGAPAAKKTANFGTKPGYGTKGGKLGRPAKASNLTTAKKTASFGTKPGYGTKGGKLGRPKSVAVVASENVEKNFYKIIEKARWGEKVHCPHCSSIKQPVEIAPVDGVPTFQCSNARCHKTFNAATGTILKTIRIGMEKTLNAFNEINNNNKISSKKLGEKIGVSQKCAWKIGQKFQELQKTQPEFLSNIVHAMEK